MSGDGSGWVAAIAAVVAAGVVAWQSIETRRSANASKEAAETAARGLDVASEALEVARAEEGHSRALIVEAHRARMDATIPAVSVVPQRSVLWPPFQAGSDRRPTARSWNRCVDDVTFALPRDGKQLLGLGGSVRLFNGSPAEVELNVMYIPLDGGDRVDRTIRLEAGKAETIEFLTWAPVEAWVDDSPDAFGQAWSSGQPFFVNWGDQLESGVGVGWEFEIVGSPLEPEEGRQGSYRLVSRDYPTLHLARQNRGYWLSRSRAIELDPPTTT